MFERHELSSLKPPLLLERAGLSRSGDREGMARDLADRLAFTRVVVWQFAAHELASGNWVPASQPLR